MESKLHSIRATATVDHIIDSVNEAEKEIIFSLSSFVYGSWKVRWLPLDHFIYRVNEANRNSLSSILSFSICVVVDQFLVLFKECFVCSFIGQVYKWWSMMFWKQVLVHVHLCLSFSPCVQGFKKIWWLENMIAFFFLTLPTWLCCCVSVLEQTTLFLMCLYNVCTCIWSS